MIIPISYNVRNVNNKNFILIKILKNKLEQNQYVLYFLELI